MDRHGVDICVPRLPADSGSERAADARFQLRYVRARRRQPAEAGADGAVAVHQNYLRDLAALALRHGRPTAVMEFRRAGTG